MNAISIAACEWRIGPAGLDEIRIVERAQRDGRVLYAVTQHSRVANRDRAWEWEPPWTPSPGSQIEDDFIARCLFETWEEAARVAQEMARREGRRR